MTPDPDSDALATDLRVLLGQLRRRLRDQTKFGDLTQSQIAVLSRLERDGPATVTALARAEGMRPQSMGAHIAALEAAQWVEGAPDPNDGRQTLIALTATCREHVRQSRLAKEDWLSRELSARLSATERAQVQAAVALLQRLIES